MADSKIAQQLGVDADLFPEVVLQLRFEINTHHPVLVAQMEEASLEGMSFDYILGVIGAYCEMTLDGEYNTLDLCKQFYSILKGNRILGVTGVTKIMKVLDSAGMQEQEQARAALMSRSK